MKHWVLLQEDVSRWIPVNRNRLVLALMSPLLFREVCLMIPDSVWFWRSWSTAVYSALTHPFSPPSWFSFNKHIWHVGHMVINVECESVSCSVMSDSTTPWTVAHQAPLPIGFSRQGFWSGLPCPPPGNFPNPGIKCTFLISPSLAGRFFYHQHHLGSPHCVVSALFCFL